MGAPERIQHIRDEASTKRVIDKNFDDLFREISRLSKKSVVVGNKTEGDVSLRALREMVAQNAVEFQEYSMMNGGEW